MMKKVDNKFCLQNKKAQSQIITTVLIILLVLAAVVIVWQVVRTTVTEGTKTLEERTACIGFNLDITDVSVGTSPANLTVKVTRGSGGPGDDDPLNLVLLVDGETTDYDEGTLSLDQLESGTLTHVDASYIAIPGKVEVGGKMGEVACDYLACEGLACN